MSRHTTFLILPEVHRHEECMVANTMLLATKLKKYAINSILFFSEGSTVHECIAGIIKLSVNQDPRLHSILTKHSLIEYSPSEETGLNRFLFFLLATDIMKPGVKLPQGGYVDEAYIMRYRSEWFPLIKDTEDADAKSLQMIRAGLRGEKGSFDTLFNEILKNITKTTSIDNDIRGYAIQLFTKKKSVKEITAELNVLRDEAMLRKIYSHLMTDTSIQLVVMIVGALHYKNLKSIIEETPGFLSIDPDSDKAYENLPTEFAGYIKKEGSSSTASTSNSSAAPVSVSVSASASAPAPAPAPIAPLTKESSIRELKAAAEQKGINTSMFVEKSDFISALKAAGVLSGGRRRVKKKTSRIRRTYRLRQSKRRRH